MVTPRECGRPEPADDVVRTEQLEHGWTPITCRSCRAAVLVRKAGPRQTSIQWSGGSGACAWRVGTVPGEAAWARSCPDLLASVETAVTTGQVPVGEATWSPPPAGRTPVVAPRAPHAPFRPEETP